MSHADVAKILALPVEERLHVIDLIWESLATSAVEIPLSDAHRKIVDERLAEHERDPDDVVSLEEALVLARRQ
jgi:putative addiction module component (TIGR02574 family)